MPRLGQLGQRLGVKEIKSAWFWGEVLASAFDSNSKDTVSKLFHLQTDNIWNFISDLCIYFLNGENLGE